MSLASGNLPSSLLFRMGSVFFGRKKRMTKAQLKKLMMRRRRMFVDNVIMHHQRLHNQNRQDAIDKTKEKISGRAPSKTKPQSAPKTSPQLSRARPQNQNNFRSNQIAKPQRPTQPKSRIKGFVDNERQKSRSKWVVRVGGNDSSSHEV